MSGIASVLLANWPLLLALDLAILAICAAVWFAESVWRWQRRRPDDEGPVWPRLPKIFHRAAQLYAIVALGLLVFLLVLAVAARSDSSGRPSPPSLAPAVERLAKAVGEQATALGRLAHAQQALTDQIAHRTPTAEPPHFSSAGATVPIIIGLAVGLFILARHRQGEGWWDIGIKAGLAGAGASLASFGALSVVKDLTVFKDSNLIKTVTVKADSLLHIQMGSEAVSPPPDYSVRLGGLDMVCRDDWTIKTFPLGWSWHLSTDVVADGALYREPRVFGEGLKTAVSEVIAKIDRYRPGGQIVLIGSTDTHRFHGNPPRHNADLANDRASHVRELIQKQPGWAAKAGEPSRVFLLNERTETGIARPILGPNETPAGRAVLVCGLWQDAPKIDPKPGAGPTRPGESGGVYKGALLGVILGAFLWTAVGVAGITAWRLTAKPAKDADGDGAEPPDSGGSTNGAPESQGPGNGDKTRLKPVVPV